MYKLGNAQFDRFVDPDNRLVEPGKKPEAESKEHRA